MSESLDEFDISNVNTPVANTKVNLPSIVNGFTGRKKCFTNDQEVFVESDCALVIVNDTNLGVPLPSFYPNQTPPQKGENSKVFLRFDSTSPKKEADLRKSVTIRKRGLGSLYDSQLRRISNTTSCNHSDTPARELGSDSGPKTMTEIDIFSEKVTETKKKPERWVKRLIRRILDSITFNTIIFVATIYTLLAEDLCTALLTDSADFGFDVVSLISIAIFTVEIMLSFYIDKSYRFSFFFWLDVISTVLIIFDIDFMMDTMFFPDNPYSIQKGGQTSLIESIGARTGRVIRIVRLVRLVKVYKQITQNKEDSDLQIIQHNLQKIYPGGLILERRETRKRREANNQLPNPLANRRSGINHAVNLVTLHGMGKGLRTQKTRTLEDSNSRIFNEHDRISYSVLGMMSPQNGRRKSSNLSRFSETNSNGSKESRVGRKLSELTTKRVIVMVLALLVLAPFCDVNFFFDPSASQKYQMKWLAELMDNSDVSEYAKKEAVDVFIREQKERDPPLVFMQVGDKVMYVDTDVDISELRKVEAIRITIQTKKAGKLVSIVNDRLVDQLDAFLGAGRTFFIFILLFLAAVMFNNDAKKLILVPLERIIEKVNRIARDPQLAKEEKLVRGNNEGFENEAIEVENAITKIAGLLALGFGDAGSAIITQNIANSGDVDPMVLGKKKAAIYGFCDIRNFTDVTEVLQEDVMIFVNSIANIVHSVVDRFTGAANKNIGDAFLLVWKFPEDCVLELSGGRLEISSGQLTQNMADCALISFLKIYARINRDPTLLEYRENPCLKSRLPNYKVKMGFGMHVGWAIEGAIGSDFKIDASYLSPNVNIASRLEAATKQYGVPLLFSGELYDMLSEAMQENSRLIDIVTVKGSVKPLELYTFDLDVEGISVAKDRSKMPREERKARQSRKKDYIKSILENSYAYTLLETDKELRYMLRNKNEEFNNLFNTGVDAYIDGDWATAKRKFEACLAIRPDDGPTKNLNRMLAENDYIAPEDWEGYHVLTEK